MAIDRKKLVEHHNPKLQGVDTSSPLTVGNGEFAFIADVTGLQTLYDTYREECPLCTMSQWGWHTKPVSEERYAWTLEDYKMQEFPYQGRTVSYARGAAPGYEEMYDWLRQNPYRLNLARVGFVSGEKGLNGGRELKAEELTGISQELKLYQGVLDSRFSYQGVPCHVQTCVDADSDTLAVAVESKLLNGSALAGESMAPGIGGLSAKSGLAVEIAFPYGAPDITASNWKSADRHQTVVLKGGGAILTGESSGCGTNMTEVSENARTTFTTVYLERILDRDRYYVAISCQQGTIDISGIDRHVVRLTGADGRLRFTVQFSREKLCAAADCVEAAGMEEECSTPGCSRSGHDGRASAWADCEQVFARTADHWRHFWEDGAMVRFESETDPRAEELERRVILSLYLMAANSSGSMPPQETGLTCNSWYGKPHLEMHFWHSAWAPLWNHSDLLEKSFPWYKEHLPEARENAARNGFQGARWPKMVAGDAIDSPSGIAVMLIWQQPHILTMLELAYRNHPEEAFLKEYWEVVKETADFMADFAVLNEQTGEYELLPPLIPVQERHAAEVSRNPAFEVEYWRFGLQTALKWAERLDEKAPTKWEEVASHMVPCTIVDGLYMAHADCPDTFEKFDSDHPSMLMAYGVLDSERIDREVMRNTLHKVIDGWRYETLWGWDFAVMAMTAGRLGEKNTVVDCLLKDTIKNVYVTSGNNRQVSRKDLPLYLPGNGSLLLAVAFLTAGGDTAAPCFPGSWQVECEGMDRYL